MRKNMRNLLTIILACSVFYGCSTDDEKSKEEWKKRNDTSKHVIDGSKNKSY